MSALSNKISNILSASYADVELRDALQTLDLRQIENTADTRRNLRLDVQKEIIECNAEVIKDFGQVAEQLRHTGEALSSLQQTCAEIRKHVNAARLEATPSIDESNNLISLREQVQTKQHILDVFKTQFLMSDDELAALTSSTEPVSDEYFQALVKTKRINKDCQALLSSDNQRLGLEILDQSTKHLEAAYQKLQRWLQREFKTLDLENPHMSFALRRALRVLAEKPALFQQCLSAFAEVRAHSLTDSFYTALTGNASTDGDRQRPIEFSAHEPLRYVGDMLAWAHSAAVSERESLEGLFLSEGNEISKSIQAGLESEPWSRPETREVFDGRKALAQVVNNNLTGVAQLLRQRIEQVIRTNPEAVTAYKIGNLVIFYQGIFVKLLEEGGFLDTLDVLEDIAVEQFKSAMKTHLAGVMEDLEGVPTTLAPPEFLVESLDELSDLLKSYDTSAAPTDTDGSGLALVLEEAFDPYIEICDRMSASLSSPELECFKLNYLAIARRALANFVFTSAKIKAVDDSIQDCSTRAVEFQYHAFLERSGLEPAYDSVSALSPGHENGEVILSLNTFSADQLEEAQQEVDEFLTSAILDARDAWSKLHSATMAQQIVRQAAERFSQAFDVVENAVRMASDVQVERAEADENAPPPEELTTLKDVFPRTGEEIRILLR